MAEEVALGAGETMCIYTGGIPSAATGPGTIKVPSGSTYEVLTPIKALAGEFLAISKIDGTSENVKGPANRAVTLEGKCPFTGDEVVKKSAFMVPMGSFAIANAPFADTKVMVLAAGTEFVPKADEEYVVQHFWSHPETGQPDGTTFTYLQTKSSVTFVIAGVTMDGIKVDASYSTTYEIDPAVFSVAFPEDLYGQIMDFMTGEIATATSLTSCTFPNMKAWAKTIGVKFVDIALLKSAPSSVADTWQSEMELKMMKAKMAMERDIQYGIAMQEVQLAGQYAMMQNKILVMQQKLEIEGQAKADIAALGKEAMGTDKNYSKVVACCCCSVAKKQSGGIWNSVELSGSAATNQTIPGISVSTQGGAAVQGKGSVEGYLDVKNYYVSPPKP